MLISIEGVSQSGKSKVIDELIKRFPHIVYVDLEYEWSKKEEDLMCCLLKRAAARAHKQEKIGSLLTNGAYVLVESYDLWFKAMACVCGVPEMYDALAKSVRNPDVIVYLDCEIEIAYGRVGRTFDITLEKQMRRIYNKEWKISVNTSQKTPEDVCELVRRKLHASMHKNS